MLVHAIFNDQKVDIAASATGDPLVWQDAAVTAIATVNNLPGNLLIEGSAADIAALVSASVIVTSVFNSLRVVATS